MWANFSLSKFFLNIFLRVEKITEISIYDIFQIEKNIMVVGSFPFDYELNSIPFGSQS